MSSIASFVMPAVEPAGAKNGAALYGRASWTQKIVWAEAIPVRDATPAHSEMRSVFFMMSSRSNCNQRQVKARRWLYYIRKPGQLLAEGPVLMRDSLNPLNIHDVGNGEPTRLRTCKIRTDGALGQLHRIR